MKENSSRKARKTRYEESASNSVKQRMKKTRDNSMDQETSIRLRSRSQLSAARSQSPGQSGDSRTASADGRSPSRKRSRQSQFEDRSPSRERIEEIIQRTTPDVAKPRVVAGRNVDPYCWVCHQLADEHVCETCPRAYHKDCLKKLKLGDNLKCECKMKTVGDRSSKIDWHPASLKKILLSVIDEAVKEDKKNPSKKNQERVISRLSQHFFKWPELPANRHLLKIVDLLSLHSETCEPPFYNNTVEFFMDVKWIYHNCNIVYGAESPTTQAALSLEKNFKRELLDVEACWECYSKRHVENSFQGDPFTSVCSKPHQIVWAKMRGSPYWPAKCLKKDKTHAEVWFFGTHDKAKLMLNQVLKISRKPPNKFISQQKYKEAMAELEIYISNYRNMFGYFDYPEEATPLSDVQSKNPRGKSKKGRYRTKSPRATSGDESADENESSTMASEQESELSKASEKDSELSKEIEDDNNIVQGTPQKKRESIMIKGIRQEIMDSLENRRKPQQLNLSVLHEDPQESKAHLAFLKFSQLAANLADEKAKNSSRSEVNIPERNLVCQMTFTADEENCPKGNMTVESGEASSESQVAVSESERTYLANSIPSNSLANSKFTMRSSDPSSSSSLPVIISTTSAASESYTSKKKYIPTNDSKEISMLQCAAEATNRSTKMLQIADQLLQTPDTEDDDDDEIVYVGESSGKNEPVLKKSVLKKEISAKAMNELMLSCRPGMKNHLQGLVNTIVEHYLSAYMDFFRQPLMESDFRMFINVYQKLMRRIELLSSQNVSLQKQLHEKLKLVADIEIQKRCIDVQNSNLRKQVEELAVKEDMKKRLQNDIIKSIVLKNEASQNEHIKSLEQQVEQLTNVKEENEMLKSKLIELEDEVRENEMLKSKLNELVDQVKELQSKKEIATVNEHLCEENLKMDVGCQTIEISEISKGMEQDSEQESSDTVSAYKKMDMLEISSFPSLDNMVPNPSQQPFYSDVQHMVMIQQSRPINSSLSLTETVVCESSNLMMTESSFISQPPVPVLSTLHTLPVVVSANPVTQPPNTAIPAIAESIKQPSSSSTAKTSRQSKKTVRPAAKNNSSKKRQKK